MGQFSASDLHWVSIVDNNMFRLVLHYENCGRLLQILRFLPDTDEEIYFIFIELLGEIEEGYDNHQYWSHELSGIFSMD